MNCNCKSVIEAQLLARFKEQSPESDQHTVELQNYGIALTPRNELKLLPVMTYNYSAMYPTKNGGQKLRRKVGSMGFKFCPFCGVENL